RAAEAERAASRLAVPAPEPPPLEPEAPEAIITIDAEPDLEPVARFESPQDLQAVEEPAMVADPPEPEVARVAASALDRTDVSNINALFDELRSMFVAAHTMEARDCLLRGRAWLASGDVKSAIPALERATSAMAVRGDAASALGRHYLRSGT